MNASTQQRQGAGGWVGKGCLLSFALLLLLVIAFAGGGYWAVKRLQNTYSTSTPTEFPDVATAWQDGTGSDLETGDAGTDEADEDPQPADAGSAPRSAASVRQRWRAFEKAADKHRKAHIELSEADINSLLQNDPKLRGKAQVTIQENVGHVKVSIPMSDLLGGSSGSWAGTLLGVEGRYFNGAATVRPSPDGNPANAEISNVRVGDQTVPDGFLDQRFFGFPSVRGLITDWLEDQEIERFEIRNNQVIAETRGR